ncbi:MAG: UDP-glucose 4-epimerase GalE [Planctomycetota bacterium]|nr:MAG: UDP-glucose 4-epimerase GalE [Planctomycetota bacterium]
MRILVVGGAGYVGSHCLQKLLATHNDAWAYDNLSQGHREAVPEGRLIIGDLLDTDLLIKTMKTHGIDVVLHFAAKALVGESVVRPDMYYKTNVTGTLSLLDAMVAADVKKIVFSSTCAVFGSVPPPITENLPKNPINPYGFTKLVIERALADYAAAFELEAAALRYFNACGASADGSIGEDHDPESHLIPIVLQVALGQRPHVQIFGTDYPTPDGTCIRDYVHVQDLADAHLRVINHLKAGQLVDYNLGTGVGVSVREVIETARRVTGKPIAVVESPRRSGDPAVLMGDASKALRELGWSAKFKAIELVIESAWAWHQANPSGFRK